MTSLISPRVWVQLTLLPDTRQLLEAGGVPCGPGASSALKDPFGELDTADAAIVGALFPGTAETFARFPRLQLICRTGIGYDRMDLAAATEAGVGIMYTPDSPTESTAEMAVGLMFSVARKIPQARQGTRGGEWKNGPEQTGFDLAGRTLGLVGFGRIGRRVAEIVSGLRMRVIAHDPLLSDSVFAERDVTRAINLESLFEQADILSVHAPLNPETYRIVSADLLARLKPGSVVINTSRGGLIDEPALYEALRSGRIAAAALDVMDPEPPQPDNPLLKMDNVIITPHIAGFTVEGRRRSQTAAVQQILGALRGEPPVNLLNRWVPRPLGK